MNVCAVGVCRHYRCNSYCASVPRSSRHVLCLSRALQVARTGNILHRQNGANAAVVEQESRIYESIEPRPRYVRLNVACACFHASCCSPCVFTRGFILLVTAALLLQTCGICQYH